MRKLVVSEFLTLDGVMQGPGSADEDRSGGFEHGGWHTYTDDAQMQRIRQAVAETDAYLFGRRTYEIMAAYWPRQPDTDFFASVLNPRPKYVVSTTLREPLEWHNSTLISSDVPAAIADLKEQPGKNISVLGSGELVQTLIRHDLVDEFALVIDPLVLGSGKRLFREGLAPLRLELIDATPTGSGVIMATYSPVVA
jgi:dihydrofolate reductase